MGRRSLTAFILFAMLLWSTAVAAIPVAAAGPSDLFFSEYIEGSSNNKALEIFNGTGAPVDLVAGGYNVQMFFNGSTTAGLTINLTGTVAHGDVFVIAQSSASAAILAVADQTQGSGWFNGDDAVVLRKGTTIIDVIGQIGVDPGTEWGTGLTSTADNTLRRKIAVMAGDPNGSDAFDPSLEWDGFATDTFGGLGFHTLISELFFSEYIEGTSNNKALEIFNGTGAAIDLAASGYSVQMFFNGSATAGLTINLIGTVGPGDVFVLAQSSASAAILAQADQTNSAGWFNGDDAVVLRKGTTIIDVIGQIGLDPGTEWGTGLTSTADNTLRRKLSVTAGDVNGSDAFDPSVEWDGFATDTFNGLGSHGVGDVGPSVASTSPVNGAGGIALNANITVSFSEPVNVTGIWYDITCASGARTATVSGFPTTFTLDPNSDFAFNELCTVTIFAANVTDQDANDPPDNMAANYVFSFNTVGPPTRIREIQGAAHISPKVGQTVSGVDGIVTGKTTNGFWMQDPAPDADPATSEGIFVFTSSAPATVTVGDAVTVAGRVLEFRPGSTGLTITELGSPTITVKANGNSLPPAIAIGSDRTPPNEVIEDDAAPDVETSGVFDPATDGIDFWESLEGMRIDLGMVVVTGPSPFDELGVLANNGAGATGRTVRGGIVVSATDKNPEKVHIRGIGFNMPDSNTGDHFTAPIVGIVDYDFGNFMIDVFTAPTRVADGVVREVTTSPGPHELTIATFNVENLDPGDGTFGTMASLIVNNLRSPDLISLEEIQDNNGETNNGIVDATTTLTMLRDAVVAAGGPTYEWREIDPVNNQDGGAPGGNIRQVLFFRTDRGVAFVDRPGAGSTTANAVVTAGGSPQLQYSPGRIDPTNSAFNASRKPLAAEFAYNGHHLFVIANHLNSKGGDDPLWGHAQPPVLSSEAQRQRQADILKAFVQQILAIDANAEIVLLGDLNDFEWSNPIMTLKSSPLNDLIETLPANERYSYVFEGNSQTLDHILVSNRLLALGATTDVVHVNAEFFDQASDHDPQVATLPLPDTTPPVFLSVPADVTAFTGPGAQGCGTFISNATLGTATTTDNSGAVTISRSGVPTANFFPVGVTTITYTATDSSGNTAIATQHVTVIDNTPPAIAAPADLTRGTGPGSTMAGIFISDNDLGLAVASDNCGVGAIARSAVPVANVFPLGTTTITFTASDLSGNSAAAVQTVTVFDNTPPVMTAPADVTVGTGAGALACGRFVSDATLGAPTVFDNSGSYIVERSAVPSGNLFPVGTTTITYLATDPAGNTATATQTVTVTDTTPPSIIAPSNAAYQAVSQVPAANASAATASDNCGTVNVTVSESSNGGAGSPASPLVIIRTYTATDGSGNTAAATQIITVIDNVPPQIQAPANLQVRTSTQPAPVCGVALIDVALGTATATDNAGPVTISRSGVPAGNLFPVGTTVITYTATDAAGNTATATQSVTVVDDTPPFIVVPANAAYQLASQVPAANAADASAIDNCGPVSISVSESSNGGAGSPASPLILTRIYTATDGSLNSASATQIITVIDNTPPSITGAPTTAPNADHWWNTPVTIHFTCSDNSGSVSCPADVTLSGDGADQSVTRTATDAAGNTATTTVGDIDIDRTQPTITFTGSATYTIAQTVNIGCLAADALSGIATSTCPTANGPATSFGVGPHTLTATATDRAGNTRTATFTFTVTSDAASLCALVQQFVTKDGVASSLCAKLDAAAAARARGSVNAHDNQIQAFINEVNAQRGKSISDENANTLISLAGGI